MLVCVQFLEKKSQHKKEKHRHAVHLWCSLREQHEMRLRCSLPPPSNFPVYMRTDAGGRRGINSEDEQTAITSALPQTNKQKQRESKKTAQSTRYSNKRRWKQETTKRADVSSMTLFPFFLFFLWGGDASTVEEDSKEVQVTRLSSWVSREERKKNYHHSALSFSLTSPFAFSSQSAPFLLFSA